MIIYDPFGKPKMGNGSLMQSYGVSARLSNNLHDGDMASRRGFTDHEHLDEVELIHMNGRVYDYNVGRFMGVDPLIQAPGNSQSINPYSYVMNNPLWGTDPSGYCSGSRIGTRGSGSVCGGGAGAISQSQADAVNGSNIFGAIASAKANGAPVGQSQTNSGTGDSVDLNSQANTLNAADGGNTSFHIEENFNTKFTGGNGTSHFEFTKELDGLAANESGNKIGDFNRGLGLVGVASALIKGKSINILKPKSTLLLPNYRLNPVNIGVSKTGKNILFPLAKYASKAGNFLGAAGIGLTILDSRIEYMRASTKVEESVVLAKATLDVTAGLGAILAAIVISNPAGIAVAGTYLLVDYLFDIKGMLRPSTSPKPRRREEELNE